MCTPTIIDASAFGTVLNKSKSAALHSWIEQGGGILVYSPEGGYGKELLRSTRMFELMKAYRQANLARQIETGAVEAAQASLQCVSTQSGAKDKPILALAKAAGALVLCSADKKLKVDFCDSTILSTIGPRQRVVYPIDANRPTQRQFLDKHRCRNPRSCEH